MGSFELNKHIQWSKIEKQGHRNNSKSKKLITLWCRSVILRIFYNSKDTRVDFPNYVEQKKSFGKDIITCRTTLCELDKKL